MDEKDLYEKQYGEKTICSNTNSFPKLRSIFARYDVSRQGLALGMLAPGESLLDIGCGDGTLLLKSASNYAELHGIDISPSRIKEAQRNTQHLKATGKTVALCQGNLSDPLPFPDSAFDTVTCLAVMEHVFDVYSLVRETQRVLKKGGVFIVNVPNIAYIKQRFRLFFGEIPVTSSPYDWDKIGWDGGHLHYFTQKTLCRLLRDNGFNIDKITGSGFFAQLRNFYPALLTGDICVKAVKI